MLHLSESAAQQPTSPEGHKILFSVPEADLPGPLPSIEEIDTIPTYSSLSGIAFVGHHYAVKYGVDVEPLEADNMMFVRRHTNVPVPRVFAVYQRQVSGTGEEKTYIVMERIKGNSLDFLWEHLNVDEKQKVTKQLKDACAALRGLPHQGFFGSLDTTQLRDGLFTSTNLKSPFIFPFKTEEALVDRLIERYKADSAKPLQSKAAYVCHVLPKLLQGNGAPVFTHGDLRLDNIMLQPDGSVAILDWETSGWYPTYWEYAAAVVADQSQEAEWSKEMGLMLEEFPNHVVWMKVLGSHNWFSY